VPSTEAWRCCVSRSEESEVGEEPGGGVDDLAGCLQCFGGLVGAGFLGGVVRVFQFVAPAGPTPGEDGAAVLGQATWRSASEDGWRLPGYPGSGGRQAAMPGWLSRAIIT